MLLCNCLLFLFGMCFVFLVREELGHAVGCISIVQRVGIALCYDVIVRMLLWC